MAADPARVHDAMVFAFEMLETRSDLDEGDVRELLFKKGYTSEVIETALANLPRLPPRLKPRPLNPPPGATPLPKPPASKPPAAPAPAQPAPMPTPLPGEIRSADPWNMPDIYPGPAPAATPAPQPTPKPEPKPAMAPLPAPQPEAKPAMAPLPSPKTGPLPSASGKKAPASAKRGRPTQGAWLFAAGAGVILLALIFAFSCGRTAPPETAPAQPSAAP